MIYDCGYTIFSPISLSAKYFECEDDDNNNIIRVGIRNNTYNIHRREISV